MGQMGTEVADWLTPRLISLRLLAEEETIMEWTKGIHPEEHPKG